MQLLKGRNMNELNERKKIYKTFIIPRIFIYIFGPDYHAKTQQADSREMISALYNLCELFTMVRVYYVSLLFLETNRGTNVQNHFLLVLSSSVYANCKNGKFGYKKLNGSLDCSYQNKEIALDAALDHWDKQCASEVGWKGSSFNKGYYACEKPAPNGIYNDSCVYASYGYKNANGKLRCMYSTKSQALDAAVSALANKCESEIGWVGQSFHVGYYQCHKFKKK